MIEWSSPNQMNAKTYTCGYCSTFISSEKGWYGTLQGRQVFIYICPSCKGPSYFDAQDGQNPGATFGGKVEGIDDASVESLYSESRKSFAAGAFTATVLACRKLLMHIAVSKGAEEGKTFLEYIEHLSSKNYIPPDAKQWVDLIRQKGNEANHEIVIMSQENAKDLIAFSEMLLKMIFEFPYKVNQTLPPTE